jgi:signal transduction histidine kinase
MPALIQAFRIRLRDALWVLLALVVGLTWAGEALCGEPLNILILSSFSKDLPAQAAFERGLDEQIGFRGGRSNVFFEFLDTPRLPLDHARQGMVSLIEQKYAGRKFDAVIAWALPAAQLIASRRNLFTPETPAIFLELSESEFKSLGQMTQRDYDLGVKIDYTASLQEALRLSQAKRIAVIAEASTVTGRSRVNRFREALATVAPQLPVDELFDLPLDEVVARTSHLPKNTIIYYLLMFSDGRGGQMTPFAAASRIAATANVPIFSQWESLIGSGVVGGYQLSMEVVGGNVGKAALAISQGKSPSSEPSMRFIYDWRQLAKWDWDDKALLPPGSVTMYQSPDLLQEYRWHLVTVAVFIVALIALAVSLARALHGRNKALRALDDERDMLAQRVLERTTELARSNQELESFAYAISHDLRAPVRSVNGFARLLEKRFGDLLAGDGIEFLDQIKTGAVQMDAMILGLLDYSRLGHQSPEKYEPADIPAIAEEAVNLLQNDLTSVGGGIEIAPCAGLPPVACNKELIRRLFQNLIENAIKYRSPERPVRVRIAFQRQNDRVKVEIHDNGVGISADRRDRVFKIFQRDAPASVPGYGIGLSLCQRIVKAHGGDIWIEDEPQAGCCFCFTLKVTPVSAAS